MYWELLLLGSTIFAVLMIIYTFQTALTDFLYVAMKKWHYTAFILICLSVGSFFGFYNARMGSNVTSYFTEVTQPKEKVVVARIANCRDFVLAKLEARPGYEDPKPPISDTIRINARTYWDSCAHTFGTNYWKHDTSINGENGGFALCRAYRQAGAHSTNVENWCSTVFAGEEKI